MKEKIFRLLSRTEEIQHRSRHGHRQTDCRSTRRDRNRFAFIAAMFTISLPVRRDADGLSSRISIRGRPSGVFRQDLFEQIVAWRLIALHSAAAEDFIITPAAIIRSSAAGTGPPSRAGLRSSAARSAIRV